MKWTPDLFTAIFAGVTLLIYFTGSVIASVIFIFKKIDATREAILLDVSVKHNENDVRYEALNKLVIRHETLLDPEFGGRFSLNRSTHRN